MEKLQAKLLFSVNVLGRQHAARREVHKPKTLAAPRGKVGAPGTAVKRTRMVQTHRSMVFSAALVKQRCTEVYRDVRRVAPADRMIKSTAETYTAKLGADTEAHAKRKLDRTDWAERAQEMGPLDKKGGSCTGGNFNWTRSNQQSE